ncbi:MAG: hypothetical protein AAFX87_16110 [Bacteroidota bacterium]
MKSMNIEEIWNDGFLNEPKGLSALEWPVKKLNRKSKQLIERIMQTARNEHRIFLIASAIALPLLFILGYIGSGMAYALFVGLMIWKYEVEMKMMKSIKFQESTVVYLKDVRRLLNKFMRNYRIGASILMPVTIALGIIISDQMKGHDLLYTLSQTIFWVLLAFGGIASAVVSIAWIKLWVNTFYGKKIKELDQMISDLE